MFEHPINPITSFYIELNDGQLSLYVHMIGETGEKSTVCFDDIYALCQHGATIESAARIFDEVCEIENPVEAFDRAKKLCEDCKRDFDFE